MDGRQSTPKRSGSSRSCSTCAKAKAKCVRPAATVRACERCLRLKKECFTEEPLARPKKSVRTTRATQFEKLENKIEYLVNALSTKATSNYASGSVQSSPPHVHGSNVEMPREAPGLIEVPCFRSAQGLLPRHETPNDFAISSQPAELPVDEIEVLLDRWRRLMFPGCPFVVIQEGTTACSLQERKPVLLHAITTVALFHDSPKQKASVKVLIADIGHRMLVYGEKSLDILQGIIVLISWYHPHLLWIQQITNLVHLAISLTIDLGIDRHPQQCHDLKVGIPRAAQAPPISSRTPSHDEHRALLGVFYLTSMLASSFKKVQAISFTPYMNEAMHNLEQALVCESDLLLIQTVRIQQLIESIHTTDIQRAPVRLCIRAFQADIERLRTIDPCSRDNIYLQMQYVTANVLMWELSLNSLQDDCDQRKAFRTHVDDLYRCATAIQAFMEVYFSLPISSYHVLPYSIFGQFAHAFIVLAKLFSLAAEGWDMQKISQLLNFAEIVEEAASRFEDAMQLSFDGRTINNESFTKWACRIRWVKQIYLAKSFCDGEKLSGTRSINDNAPQVSETYESPKHQHPTPPSDVLPSDFFYYLDENFWQSLSGDLPTDFPELGRY